MLLIHRSILKELLTAFVLSLLFLNFTLMMEELLKISRLLPGIGVSVADMSLIVLYLQPHVLTFTIPMAMLLSVLLTYGRMNADNEMIILRGSGISFRAISVPVAYLGMICFIISLSMSFYISPKGNNLLKEKVSEILTQRAPMTIKEGIFNTAFKDIVIMVKEKPAPDRFSGIFILDKRDKDEQKIITARHGKIIPGKESLGFLLTDGHIYITKEKAFTEIGFGEYNFRLSPSAEARTQRDSELTPFELLRASREFPDKKTDLLLEFHRRLSMPAICLILVMLGPSLSLMAGKSGRLGGLTVGLAVFAVYYTLLLYGESLSRSDKLPLFAGAWLAFAMLGMFSFFIFERVNRK